MQCHSPCHPIDPKDASIKAFIWSLFDRAERTEPDWGVLLLVLICDWTGWILRRGAEPPIYGRIVVWSSVNLIATNNQPYPIISVTQERERDGISDIPLLPGLLSSVERRNSNQISYQTNNEATQPCPAQPSSRQEMFGMKIKWNQRLCFPNWVVGTTTVEQ